MEVYDQYDLKMQVLTSNNDDRGPHKLNVHVDQV